jgi:hypothetical protein
MQKGLSRKLEAFSETLSLIFLETLSLKESRMCEDSYVWKLIR